MNLICETRPLYSRILVVGPMPILGQFYGFNLLSEDLDLDPRLQFHFTLKPVFILIEFDPSMEHQHQNVL